MAFKGNWTDGWLACQFCNTFAKRGFIQTGREGICAECVHIAWGLIPRAETPVKDCGCPGGVIEHILTCKNNDCTHSVPRCDDCRKRKDSVAKSAYSGRYLCDECAIKEAQDEETAALDAVKGNE